MIYAALIVGLVVGWLIGRYCRPVAPEQVDTVAAATQPPTAPPKYRYDPDTHKLIRRCVVIGLLLTTALSAQAGNIAVMDPFTKGPKNLVPGAGIAFIGTTISATGIPTDGVTATTFNTYTSAGGGRATNDRVDTVQEQVTAQAVGSALGATAIQPGDLSSSIASTATNVAANSAAVKTAYDLAAGKLSPTSDGSGLTGITAGQVGAATVAQGVKADSALQPASTIYRLADYADLQAAVDAAAVVGGTVLNTRGAIINISTSLVPKTKVTVDLNGGTLKWIGAAGGIMVENSTAVAGPRYFGIINGFLDPGANAAVMFKLHSTSWCFAKNLYWISGNNTLTAVWLLADAAYDEIGFRNSKSNDFSSFGPYKEGSSALVNKGIILEGQADCSSGVTLNKFTDVEFTLGGANAVAYEFRQCADSNTFAGNHRVDFYADGAKGVVFNSGNPTINNGIYNNFFEHTAFDIFHATNNCTAIEYNYSHANIIAASYWSSDTKWGINGNQFIDDNYAVSYHALVTHDEAALGVTTYSKGWKLKDGATTVTFAQLRDATKIQGTAITGVVASVGSPGTNNNIPTEAAVRSAIAASGGGTVTSVTSANTDISVATTTTTPVLTLNSGIAASQIVKLSADARLGVGTAAPTTPLHVVGKATVYQSDKTAASQGLLISGAGILAASPTDVGGLLFQMGYNAAGNRQLWLMDSGQTASATNYAIRYITGFQIPILSAVSTDGSVNANINIQTNNAGRVGIGFPSASPQTAVLAKLHVITESASIPATITQAATSQTANIQEWRDSSATVLASVSATGSLAAKTFTGTIPAATTYGATTTVDLSLGDSPKVTLTGATTLAFSNPVAGQWHKFRIKQDATGNRAVTWPSTGLVCTWLDTSNLETTTAPAINLAANAVTEIIIHTTSATTAECYKR